MLELVIPKLMNSTIVGLLNSVLESEKREIKITHVISEKSLLGYCSFHHMLLYYARQYPEIKTYANSIVKDFVTDEQSRIKSAVPNLGEFLIYFTISEYSWNNDFGIIFLKELFDRFVKWTIEKYPELARIESDPVSLDRISKTWTGNLTSLRLIMFQVYFIKNVGHPEGKSQDDVLRYYNNSCGLPNKRMRSELVAVTQTILSIDEWPKFFNFIHVKLPSREKFTSLLKKSVRNSIEKGYHGGGGKGGRGGGRGGRGGRGGGRGRRY